jgi:hypothetical protein
MKQLQVSITRRFVSMNLSTQFLRQFSVLESNFEDGLSTQVSQHLSFNSCTKFWNKMFWLSRWLYKKWIIFQWVKSLKEVWHQQMSKDQSVSSLTYKYELIQSIKRTLEKEKKMRCFYNDKKWGFPYHFSFQKCQDDTFIFLNLWSLT